jgi:hypothetical protein
VRFGLWPARLVAPCVCARGVLEWAVAAGGAEELVAGFAGGFGLSCGGGSGARVGWWERVAGLVVVVVGDAAEGLDGAAGGFLGEEVGAGAVELAEAFEGAGDLGGVGPVQELEECEAVDDGDADEIGVGVEEHFEELLVVAFLLWADVHAGASLCGGRTEKSASVIT